MKKYIYLFDYDTIVTRTILHRWEETYANFNLNLHGWSPGRCALEASCSFGLLTLTYRYIYGVGTATPPDSFFRF